MTKVVQIWYGVSERAIGYTYSIYRERNNDGHLELVCKIAEGSLGFYDYGVRNNSEYKYYIFKESQADNTSSYANGSDPIKVCFGNYVLCDLSNVTYENNIPIFDIDINNIWQFSLELQNGGIQNITNTTVHDTFGQFPKMLKGKNNYDKSTFTCLFGNIENDKYYEPADKWEAFKTFANNGNMKLLRDMKGNSWIVGIVPNSLTPNDQIGEVPRYIKLRVDTTRRQRK